MTGHLLASGVSIDILSPLLVVSLLFVRRFQFDRFRQLAAAHDARVGTILWNSDEIPMK